MHKDVSQYDAIHEMKEDIRDTIEVDGSITEHIPVLAETLAEQIKLPPDGIMVDATIGQGGHSSLFGKTLGPEGVIVGLDVDKNSIQRAQFILKGLSCKVILVQSNFSRISEEVHEQGIEKVDFILADLGLCSAQLADSRMGLSFLEDMPLDMRIDKRIKSTAADIVNKTDEKSLADLIYELGQDRASRRIGRKKEPITTTGQLAKVVCRALAKADKGRRRRIHPATRTFQALRIAVNDELENLKRLLDSSPGLLRSKGYIAIISYHSLEDRLVKYNFKENKSDYKRNSIELNEMADYSSQKINK